MKSIKIMPKCLAVAILLSLVLANVTTNKINISDAGRLSAPKITSIKSTSSSKVTMKWKKVKGAKRYKIYRASSKNGKYKYIKTVKKNKYTDTSVVCSTKYYYKVKAYTNISKKSINSKCSSAKGVKVKKLETPFVYDSDNKNVMFYVQIPKNTSYEVYRDKSQDKYEYIGEFNKEKFYDKTIPYNITCYYKFRTKKVVNGKTYYSKYSMVSFYYLDKKSAPKSESSTSDTNDSDPNATTNEDYNDYEAPSDEMSNQILELLNTDRVAQGLQPLTMIKGLNLAAEIRAKELQIAYQHPRPQGGTKVELAASCGFKVTDYISENIMMNSTTAKEFYTAWYNSPKHHDAMFSKRATKVGIAVYKDENGVLYGVQLFSN